MDVGTSTLTTSADSGDVLSVRLLQGTRGLEAIRPAWEDLARNAEPAGFYHQYEWYASYLKHLDCDPQSMLFLWASRGSKTVGILPLKYRKAKWGGGVRVLQLPSHDHLCVADALVRNGEDHAEVMNCMIRHLRRMEMPRWDELLFPEVPAGSAVERALGERGGVLLVRETARASDSIPNAGGYEETVHRLSGSFKRDLRRKFKHARNSGTLTYRSVESPDELEDAFSTFLELEGSGWKGPGGTRSAINCNPELEDFYRSLMNTRNRDLHCVINLLHLDDTCIAAEFCLYCNGVLSLLKIGYLEKHGRISPGSLLFDCVLRDWCERPGVRAISLVGDAAWQKSWHPEEKPVFRYRVYNRTLRALPARLWRAVRPSLAFLRNRVVLLLQQKQASGSRQRGSSRNSVART